VVESVFNFYVRSIHTLSPDRIYRVELCNGALYFLRVGGQFDVDRKQLGLPGQVPAVLILAAGEALFRKHKKEELVARDPNLDPEVLLALHPHNFKLGPDEIKRAIFLPKKWFLSFFRSHFGRLAIELVDGMHWEFHFERLADLRAAFENLDALLGQRLDTRITWDANQGQFVRRSR
jgi:hypothetical protein